jgi:Fe-S-cluster containining protein
MDRIAKHLNISTSDFLMNYLEMDEEGDFVYKQQPCPFLLKDNKCKIYDVRPEACADFPHTNRNDMNEILDLTLTNSTVCPAVSRMIKNMLSNT